jgi:hypothetical protein
MMSNFADGVGMTEFGARQNEADGSPIKNEKILPQARLF